MAGRKDGQIIKQKRGSIASGSARPLPGLKAIPGIFVGAIDDALYEEMRRHFDERMIVDLTLAAIAINGWNRLAIPFRTPTRGYEAWPAARL